VSISEESQRLVGFEFCGQKFVYKTLPFGLNVSVYVMQKITSQLAIFCRRFGKCVWVYIDDFYAVASSLEEAQNVQNMLKSWFEKLGITLNWEKEKTTNIGTVVEFLGVNINLQEKRIEVDKKLHEARQQLNIAFGTKFWPKKFIEGIIGKLNFLASLNKVGHLYLYHLEMMNDIMQKQSMQDLICLDLTD